MARVAVVTGGTRGIGRAITTALNDAGYRVAANYGHDDATARQFSEETGIPVYKFNVADFAACVEGVKAVEAQLKFAELRLGQYSQLQRSESGRAFDDLARIEGEFSGEGQDQGWHHRRLLWCLRDDRRVLSTGHRRVLCQEWRYGCRPEDRVDLPRFRWQAGRCCPPWVRPILDTARSAARMASAVWLAPLPDE